MSKWTNPQPGLIYNLPCPQHWIRYTVKQQQQQVDCSGKCAEKAADLSWLMVLRLDGSLLHDTHVWTITDNLICSRHLFKSTAFSKMKWFFKIFFFVLAQRALSYHLIQVSCLRHARGRKMLNQGYPKKNLNIYFLPTDYIKSSNQFVQCIE